MKKIALFLFLMSGIVLVFANGQQEGATGSDAFADYQNWSQVNQQTITGDETGVLGSAHERAKGIREIFVNDIGKPVAYGESDYPYPTGAILLKESYKAKDGMKSGKPGLTIMVKREDGYDPDNGNWEYLMANSELKISRQGKIGMCIGCHSAASGKDFTFWDSSL